ncbi:hypothetical protein G6F68_014365 [Rhizopus microsporus]|nr:hypothetical protein G6F68_014365 [Rhizopus microsporus]
MNSPAAVIGPDVASAAHYITNTWGFTITPEQLTATAAAIGEPTILHRAGDTKQQRRYDGVLVPLRDPVRSVVHPDRGGRRHPCRALHAAGPAGQLRASVEEDRVVDRQHHRHRRLRGAVGISAVHRRGRSVRGHPDAVAAVRHFQPDAGRHRADAGHGGAVQDEA